MANLITEREESKQGKRLERLTHGLQMLIPGHGTMYFVSLILRSQIPNSKSITAASLCCYEKDSVS